MMRRAAIDRKRRRWRSAAAGSRRVRVWAATLAAVAVAGLGAGWTVTGVVADRERGQDQEVDVMVAAGQWALDQLPAGQTRLDPHRSGAGKDGARLRRVAQLLGASLVPLDETRECQDAVNPSTCRLAVPRVLAIGAPRIAGDRAEVRVYAWYRSSSAREPVAQRSWELRLNWDGQGWRVVSSR